MRQVREFKNLLKQKVNLDDTRLGLLEDRVEAVFRVLKADEGIGGYIKDKIPQGSWAHRTIIKPAPGQEFDGDFLVRMVEVEDWHDNPVTYLKYLAKVLDDHGTYKGKVTRKRRCVRVTYAGDCHLDVVPFVRRADDTTWIINGEKNEWEPTDPEGYTKWINGKDTATSGNLRKVVRQMKFLRDRMGAFTDTKSIILTTLVGGRVEDWHKVVDPARYADLPTTLVRIVEDLDDYLQANASKPHMADPSAPTATFDHRWTDETYATLRTDIHRYRALMRAALDETDPAQSRRLWQDIFGDGFDAPDEGGRGGAFGVVPPAPSRSGRAG